MTKALIPWAEPALWGSERDYVMRALDSTWISGGPFVEELEQRMAVLCEVPHALAVCNGTAALHLAYLALGLGPGDEVIVPGFAFQAAANVALHVGAQPIFADVDPRTWCVTAETLRPCLTSRTRALVAVHTYGNVCPMEEITELATRYGVSVIEDVAEALESRSAGRPAGSFGAMACFSFQATKTITTGEGGMILTRDAQFHERMALYRSHGMLRRRYWHEVPGHNFRLTNLQAALGCAQLDHLGKITAERRRVGAGYAALLRDQPGIELQYFKGEVDPIVWAVACRLDRAYFPQGRDGVMNALLRAGIETRPGFYPPSIQPIYGAAPLLVADAIAEEVIVLPSSPTLTQESLGRVARELLALRTPRGFAGTAA